MPSGRRKRIVNVTTLIAITLFELVNLGGLYFAFTDPGLASWVTTQLGSDSTKMLIARLAIWLAILVVTNGLMILMVHLIKRWEAQSADAEILPDPISTQIEAAETIHRPSNSQNNTARTKNLDEQTQPIRNPQGRFSQPGDFDSRLIDGAQLKKLRQQATKGRKPTAKSR